MKNLGVIILIIWGMFQFIVMLLLAVIHENAWIACGLVVTDIGIMYLVVDCNERLEAKLKGE